MPLKILEYIVRVLHFLIFNWFELKNNGIPHPTKVLIKAKSCAKMDRRNRAMGVQYFLMSEKYKEYKLPAEMIVQMMANINGVTKKHQIEKLIQIANHKGK